MIARDKFIIVGLAFSLITAAIALFLSVSQKQVAYIELAKVFEECKYCNEQREAFENSNKNLIGERDSLSSIMESLIKEKSQYSDTSGVVGYYLKALDDRINALNSVLNTDESRVNEKIWNYLNRQAAQFGKSTNYDVILGARGDGGIMYGKDAANASEEFLNYLETNLLNESK